MGSKGMMRIVDETLEMFTRVSEGKETIDCAVSPTEGMHMGCRREFDHLIDCLRHNRQPLNNADNALETLKLALAAEKASIIEL